MDYYIPIIPEGYISTCTNKVLVCISYSTTGVQKIPCSFSTISSYALSYLARDGPGPSDYSPTVSRCIIHANNYWGFGGGGVSSTIPVPVP